MSALTYQQNQAHLDDLLRVAAELRIARTGELDHRRAPAGASDRRRHSRVPPTLRRMLRQSSNAPAVAR